ncbi:hypothetical protein SAMN05216327_12425 [Dyadobacter sp. SG02]|uniref:hypothetical protein n=1 Tax=Dyadobacter sp. SG02 TaxID=1855291 RepID=UPI0008B4C3C1|nr:hypothetical protein [Dyadobacter sp. SG02]SEJ84488.1 hypothetical protein SAMN05216327_12425 [Dyadobacter sp. SG02]
MKKLVFYVVMIFCGLPNVSAGCSEKEVDAVEVDNGTLTGYWKLLEGASLTKKSKDGDWVQTATIKPGVFAYEFKPDNTFISYDLTGNFPAAKGTWKLDVKSQTGKEIGSAGLFLYSDNFKDIADTDALETDGAMKFQLSIKGGRLHLVSKEIALGGSGKYPYMRNEMTFVQGK